MSPAAALLTFAAVLTPMSFREDPALRASALESPSERAARLIGEATAAETQLSMETCGSVSLERSQRALSARLEAQRRKWRQRLAGNKGLMLEAFPPTQIVSSISCPDTQVAAANSLTQALAALEAIQG